jgi:hypothetical protein
LYAIERPKSSGLAPWVEEQIDHARDSADSTNQLACHGISCEIDPVLLQS